MEKKAPIAERALLATMDVPEAARLGRARQVQFLLRIREAVRAYCRRRREGGKP
jgi:hypothetical protein